MNDICPNCGSYGEPKVYLSKYRGWECDNCFNPENEKKHKIVCDFLEKYLTQFDDEKRIDEVYSIIMEIFDNNNWFMRYFEIG